MGVLSVRHGNHSELRSETPMSEKQLLTILVLDPAETGLEDLFRHTEGFAVLATETVEGAVRMERTARIDAVIADLAGFDEWPADVAAALVEAFADRLPVVLLCGSSADRTLLAGRYPIANVALLERASVSDAALVDIVRGRGTETRAGLP